MQGWFWTPAQRHTLEAALTRTHDVALFRRVMALLQVDQGQPVAQVAHELQVGRRSIYRWMEHFAATHQVEILGQQPGQGRPSNWDTEFDELLEAALDQLPLHLGYPANTWTVPLLQSFLTEHLPDQPVSETSLRRHLKALGYVWKRYRYVLAPDPQAEKKTPYFGPNSGFAARKRPPGRRRKRRAALSAPARRLGPAWRAGTSAALGL